MRVCTYIFSNFAYDRYARNYHSEEDGSDEKIDHGILGGFVVFDNLVRKAVKSGVPEQELVNIKACSMTIAQHNIFKSDSLERDIDYLDEQYSGKLEYLTYNSGFYVTNNTPLLLLLCLVDTLECVKKFSKEENKENSISLRTKTVLSSIYLTVTEDTIEIDLSALHKNVDAKGNKDFSDKYNSYRKAVVGFGSWTAFQAHSDTNNPDLITITLSRPNARKSTAEKELQLSC